MALTTSKINYRAHYKPLVAGIFVAPYPHVYYYGLDEDCVTDFAMREQL